MKRFLVWMALAAAVALVAPAAADAPEAGSCSATTGVTASALAPATAPVCTFEVDCDALGDCLYVFTLDVNGTGLVSGTMSVEPVSGEADFTDAVGDPQPDPFCSGGFQCHASTEPSPLVLIEATDVFRVVCSGGGLAAVETVGCSVTFLG